MESERESVNSQLNVGSLLDASENVKCGKEVVLAGVKTALGRDQSRESSRR